LNDIVFDEYDVVSSICRESFYDFVREFWEIIITEKPVWNWHIPYLCGELQEVAERVFRGEKKKYDLIINISPGSTKSTICSVMFPAWVWTRMPSAKVIGASYSKDLAGDLSRKNRDIIKSPKYLKCFPEIQLRDDQDVKTYFMNNKKGFRIAVGTGGITGYHGHFIMVDDPLNPNEALSEAELASTNTWMFETLANRKVDPNITPTILIMQRLHQDDPTAQMLKRTKNIKHICLPATVTERLNPPELEKYYINGLMDVDRLNQNVLDGYFKALGERGYAGQYLQAPAPAGGSLFKIDRITIDVPPQEFKRVVRFWDKAGTAMGGAYTAGVKMGLDTADRIWILNVVRGQWDTAQRERTIKKFAEMDGPHVIVGVEQEPGSGGKESAENTARNLMGYRVLITKPTGDKTVRAEPFSTQVNARNVSMACAPWNSDYVEELMYFPDSTYKDQVDATSGAFTIISKPTFRAGAIKVKATHRRRRFRLG
jgi:predicted phage terminase large subunit-like protein